MQNASAPFIRRSADFTTQNLPPYKGRAVYCCSRQGAGFRDVTHTEPSRYKHETAAPGTVRAPSEAEHGPASSGCRCRARDRIWSHRLPMSTGWELRCWNCTLY